MLTPTEPAIPSRRKLAARRLDIANSEASTAPPPPEGDSLLPARVERSLAELPHEPMRPSRDEGLRYRDFVSRLTEEVVMPAADPRSERDD